MAKNKRGRAYKMTPRRKAALRKAQEASARARRRRVGRAAGLVGATLAAGAVVYAGRKQFNKQQTLSRSRLRSVAIARKNARPARKSKALVHVPGMGVDHMQMRKTVIPKGWGQTDLPRPRSIRTTPSSVFKVNSQGVASRTTKNRMIYDLNRRRGYWQGKPVGGQPRKKYVSKKRGRR